MPGFYTYIDSYICTVFNILGVQRWQVKVIGNSFSLYFLRYCSYKVFAARQVINTLTFAGSKIQNLRWHLHIIMGGQQSFVKPNTHSPCLILIILLYTASAILSVIFNYLPSTSESACKYLSHMFISVIQTALQLRNVDGPL